MSGGVRKIYRDAYERARAGALRALPPPEESGPGGDRHSVDGIYVVRDPSESWSETVRGIGAENQRLLCRVRGW